ncbi:DMT family transporter [Flavobacteriaceae bacterium F08102]|nr:DMT family transporter [Flavobacteriaceae bacterium F08102]
MLNDKLKNYLHLHFIIFIWGFTAVLGRLISIEAISLVWYRVGIAVVLILGFILFKKLPLKVDRKTLGLFVFGGILIALHWITFFHAIKISNVSVALATMSTGALFVTLIQWLVYRKKIVLYELIFSLLAISGLLLIFNAATHFFWGILVALVSSFLSASFSILNGRLIQKHPASVISFYELLFSVLTVTMILLYNGTLTGSFFVMSATDWLYLGILASICTAYAFVASTYVLKNVSPFTMMLSINLEPIYGIILAILIFKDDEIMNENFYIGAAIILITVVLNGVLSLRKKGT